MGEGLSWEVTGRQWLCLGRQRQIWYMALNPGQKDLARVDRQQDGLPNTAFPHSMLGVEAGGRLTDSAKLSLPSLVRSKWWFLEESVPCGVTWPEATEVIGRSHTC